MGAGPHRIALRCAPLERCPHEGDEQRMSSVRVGCELGVKLAAEEPWMIGELDHFAQIASQGALCPRADDESRGFKPWQIVIVDLVAMAVALGDARRTVDPMRKR